MRERMLRLAEATGYEEAVEAAQTALAAGACEEAVVEEIIEALFLLFYADAMRVIRRQLYPEEWAHRRAREVVAQAKAVLRLQGE